jgi:hypothetical protein
MNMTLAYSEIWAINEYQTLQLYCYEIKAVQTRNNSRGRKNRAKNGSH